MFSIRYITFLVFFLFSFAVYSAEPEDEAVKIVDTGSLDLPVIEHRFIWNPSEARPKPITRARFLKFQLWYGLSKDRFADMGLTVARERFNAEIGRWETKIIAMVPIDRYANPSGAEILVNIELKNGVVIKSGDRIVVLCSATPIQSPQPPSPVTRAHFGVVGYWIPEPEETEE